jgi:hypothetical protein
MRERRDADLSPRLRAAIQVLRESSTPDESWRSALLDRIESDSQEREEEGRLHVRPGVRSRRWTMRPLAAIAAGMACVLAGAATTALLLRAPAPPASSPAEATRAAVLPVRFTLVAPGAAKVSLVGDFNRWDPAALPLRRSSDGRTWEVEVRLAPGRYGYSFVVDGRLARDPTAPQEAGDDFGTPNSVLLLRGSS